MGFFQDLKEDLSQAVNELMPDESLESETAADKAAENAAEQEVTSEDLADLLEALGEETKADETAAEVMAVEAGSSVTADMTADLTDTEPADLAEPAAEGNLDNILESVTAETEKKVEGTERKMDTQYTNYGRTAVDETALITRGMKITGDIQSEGSMDIIGTVEGNIDILGKLNVTGTINGNSKAAEVYAEDAKITGEIVSEGTIKIGQSSVIIGNLSATSAVIAGAVKGDIDVKGPVILDTSAIVMGNIKSKSVQINNGAVIEGLCSQCYADVSPTSFFDDIKKAAKK